MAIEDFKIQFEELHTIRTKYNDKSYFKPQPTYPEIIDADDEGYQFDEDISDEIILDNSFCEILNISNPYNLDEIKKSKGVLKENEIRENDSQIIIILEYEIV